MERDSKLRSLFDILRRERVGGFKDSTVIGGLDRFLERWAGELKPFLGQDGGKGSGHAGVRDGSYAILTPAQRGEWADAVLSRIKESAAPNAGTRPRGHATQRPPIPKKPAKGPKNRPARTLGLDDPVSVMRGVSSQNVARLKRLGVQRVADLIYLFPHRHNDFAKMHKVAELELGEDQTIVVNVWEATTSGRNPRRKSTQAILGDETGNVRAIWFNQPWLARTLQPGTQVVISGKVNVFRGQFVFESPEYELLRGQEELVHTGRLVPVYPSTEGLPQRTLRRFVKQALDACVADVVEYLPDDTRHRTGMLGLRNAVAQAHYPDSDDDWKAARRRLAFDELFLMQLTVLLRKRQWQEDGKGIPLVADPGTVSALLAALPFRLTGAQSRVLGEIVDDLAQARPMSRLLQGDVGSGKTVVAAIAMLVAVSNGYQSALMAPTEILAEQHYATLTNLLSGVSEPSHEEYLVSVRIDPLPRPVSIGLLLGSLSKRAKDDLHKRIAEGDVDLIIGTHALIQTSVEIPRLAAIVVDEQQRFGVMQRASLREKGLRPHLLAMSATPIPRSLALTIYGDLDTSVIDELPPGREQIRTRWVESTRREAAYDMVRKEVQAGHQAFIVCPLIEASEAIQTKAATEEHQRLSTKVFPELRLGIIHGRMALREKEKVMGMFQRQELDILVSTPVIEVGIDIPNATVMLIDGADRFGLAQLHQFRGRVGRGPDQSYCLLLADSPGQEARERLKILERVQDGFQLAEEDLILRGPGDRLGTRQSGLPALRVARLSDHDILSLARREAARVLDADPELSKPVNAPLAQHLERLESVLPGEMS